MINTEQTQGQVRDLSRAGIRQRPPVWLSHHLGEQLLITLSTSAERWGGCNLAAVEGALEVVTWVGMGQALELQLHIYEWGGS